MRQLPNDMPTDVRTGHAMLVPWGIFAQRIGLLDALEEVPSPQQEREHRPRTKLIEFLAAVLSGCPCLQEFNRGPHPLNQNRAVAQAWGQEKCADYGGMSRNVKASTDETVISVEDALE